jgi:hypothetical protein
LAIGGFRVIATDEPVTETGEPPGEGPLESDILDCLRLLVGAFVVMGMAMGIGIVWKAACALSVVDGLVLAAGVAGWLGFYMILGALMPPFTRALRDDSSNFGWLVKGLVACGLVVQWASWLLVVVCILWRMWVAYFLSVP